MKKGLTNNQLKIFALVAMTIDHIGMEIFPNYSIFRIIGRLAFPIFAYMIAEGCRYTKNRKKYFALIFGEALICQLVFFLVEQSLYMCIFVTFSFSVIIIYLLDKAQKENKVSLYALSAFVVLAVFIVCEVLPKLINSTDFEVDYGFIGAMMPVAVYFAKDDKWKKLIALFVMCLALGAYYGGIQYYGILVVLPMLLYNGQRGKRKFKYVFYIYYPLHLVVIYFISQLI